MPQRRVSGCPSPSAHTFPLSLDLPATPPQLVSPQVLEVDTQGTVVCSLDGLFPVSEAQVYLALGDQKLNPTITYGNNSLSAKASVKVTAEEEGTQQLLCAVMLGTQTQETRQTVTIYSKKGQGWSGASRGCDLNLGRGSLCAHPRLSGTQRESDQARGLRRDRGDSGV